MSESSLVIQKLRERFGKDVEDATVFPGDPVVMVTAGRIPEIIEFLKTDPALGFEMFLDLCGADYPEKKKRFEVVYNLRSMRLGQHLRLRAELSEPDPSIPSVVSLFAAANWFEREAYDMFGITFEGHPNLRRLLTHEEFEGHPLRKDYASTARHRCTRTAELD